MSKENPEIYFSYAWGDPNLGHDSIEHFIDELYLSLKTAGYLVKRDKMDSRYGDLISDFMRQIGEADLVVIGISDKYLKSHYCMWELCEIYRNCNLDSENFIPKLLPIRIEDINFDPRSRRKYIEYWEERYIEINQLISDHPDSINTEDQKDQQKIRTIRHDFTAVIGQIKDINSLTKALLQENDFERIKKEINSRAGLNLYEDPKPPESSKNKNELTFEQKQLLILNFILDKDTQQYSVDQLSIIFTDEIPSYEVKTIVEEFVSEDVFKKLPLSLAGYWIYQNESLVPIKIEAIKKDIRTTNEDTFRKRRRKREFFAGGFIAFLAILFVFFVYLNRPYEKLQPGELNERSYQIENNPYAIQIGNPFHNYQSPNDSDFHKFWLPWQTEVFDQDPKLNQDISFISYKSSSNLDMWIMVYWPNRSDNKLSKSKLEHLKQWLESYKIKKPKITFDALSLIDLRQEVSPLLNFTPIKPGNREWMSLKNHIVFKAN